MKKAIEMKADELEAMLREYMGFVNFVYGKEPVPSTDAPKMETQLRFPNYPIIGTVLEIIRRESKDGYEGPSNETVVRYKTKNSTDEIKVPVFLDDTIDGSPIKGMVFSFVKRNFGEVAGVEYSVVDILTSDILVENKVVRRYVHQRRVL